MIKAGRSIGEPEEREELPEAQAATLDLSPPEPWLPAVKAPSQPLPPLPTTTPAAGVKQPLVTGVQAGIALGMLAPGVLPVFGVEPRAGYKLTDAGWVEDPGQWTPTGPSLQQLASAVPEAVMETASMRWVRNVARSMHGLPPAEQARFDPYTQATPVEAGMDEREALKGVQNRLLRATGRGKREAELHGEELSGPEAPLPIQKKSFVKGAAQAVWDLVTFLPTTAGQLGGIYLRAIDELDELEKLRGRVSEGEFRQRLQKSEERMNEGLRAFAVENAKGVAAYMGSTVGQVAETVGGALGLPNIVTNFDPDIAAQLRMQRESDPGGTLMHTLAGVLGLRHMYQRATATGGKLKRVYYRKELAQLREEMKKLEAGEFLNEVKLRRQERTQAERVPETPVRDAVAADRLRWRAEQDRLRREGEARAARAQAADQASASSPPSPSSPQQDAAAVEWRARQERLQQEQQARASEVGRRSREVDQRGVLMEKQETQAKQDAQLRRRYGVSEDVPMTPAALRWQEKQRVLAEEQQARQAQAATQVRRDVPLKQDAQLTPAAIRWQERQKALAEEQQARADAVAQRDRALKEVAEDAKVETGGGGAGVRESSGERTTEGAPGGEPGAKRSGGVRDGDEAILPREEAKTPAVEQPVEVALTFEDVGKQEWDRVEGTIPLAGQSYPSAVALLDALRKVPEEARGYATRSKPVQGEGGRWRLETAATAEEAGAAWRKVLPLAQGKIKRLLAEQESRMESFAEERARTERMPEIEPTVTPERKERTRSIEEMEAGVNFKALELETDAAPAVDPAVVRAGLEAAVKTAASGKASVEQLQGALKQAEGVPGLERLVKQAKGALRAAEEKGATLRSGIDPFQAYQDIAKGMGNLYSLSKEAKAKLRKRLRKELKGAVVGWRAMTDATLEEVYKREGYNTGNWHRAEHGARSTAIDTTQRLKREAEQGMSRVERDAFEKLLEARRVLSIERSKEPGREYGHNITVEQAQALVDAAPPEVLARADAVFEQLREHGLRQLHREGRVTDEQLARYGDLDYIQTAGELAFLRPQTSRKLGAVRKGVQEPVVKLRKGAAGERLAPVWARVEQQLLTTQQTLAQQRASTQLARLAVNDVGALVRTPELTKTGGTKEAPSGYKEVPYWVKGERKVTWVHEELAKGWLTSDVPMDAPLYKVATLLSGSQIMKLGTVGTNPIVALKLLPMDLLHSWMAMTVWGREGKQPLYSMLGPVAMWEQARVLPSALRDAFTKKDSYQRALEDGLISDFLVSQGDPFRGVKGRLETQLLTKGLGRFNVALETAGRLVNYENVLRFIAERDGRSLAEVRLDKAARVEAVGRTLARINYAEAGTITRGAEVVLPFTKASVAATRGLVEAFKTDKKAYAAKMGQVMALATAAYLYNSRTYPEELGSISPEVRLNNLILMLPTKTRDEKTGAWRQDYLKFPLDQGQRWGNALAQWGLGALLNDPVYDAGALHWHDVLKSSQELLGPLGTSPAPSIAAIFALNGYDLRRMESVWREEMRPGSQLYLESTPMWARDLGTDTVDPKTLQLIFNSFGLDGNFFFDGLGGGWTLATRGTEELEKLSVRDWAMETPARVVLGRTSPWELDKRPLEETQAEARGTSFVQRRDFDQLWQDYKKTKGDEEHSRMMAYVVGQADPAEQERLLNRYVNHTVAESSVQAPFWNKLMGVQDGKLRGREFARKLRRSTEDTKEVLWRELGLFKGLMSEDFVRGYVEEQTKRD